MNHRMDSLSEPQLNDQDMKRELRESANFVNARRVAHEARQEPGIQYELSCKPLF